MDSGIVHHLVDERLVAVNVTCNFPGGGTTVGIAALADQGEFQAIALKKGFAVVQILLIQSCN